MSSRPTSEDARSIEAANTSFYTAVETGDLDLLEALWVNGSQAEDAVCVHPGWPPLRGRSEVLRSFAVILANTPYIQFFLTDVDVRVTADVAVLTCVENILTGLPGGEEPGEEPLGFAGGKVVTTNVFRRTRAGWRMWLHHASPVLADEEDEDADDDEEAR